VPARRSTAFQHAGVIGVRQNKCTPVFHKEATQETSLQAAVLPIAH
jgi:hypothetical protein